MEISNTSNIYGESYLEKLKTEREEMQKEEIEKKTETKDNILKDEYIKSEETDNISAGIYKLGHDENGKPKILFDSSKNKTKKCTINTDRVDQEIEKLKKEKTQIQQQLKSASGDKKKIEELNKKLMMIDSEINQKSTDTYRQQNSAVSYS